FFLPKEISESETQAQETRHLEDLIDRHPQAQLIFWRENDGETLFPVHLERVKSGGLSVLRAAHVFRQPGGHRSNYRLTVNLPITYQYLSLEEISRTTRPPKPASQEDGQPAPEKGRIIDLSFRGAAFVCNRSLAPGGLVRLNFSIHNQPVTIIGEIIKTSVDKDDNWTHNMHVRGVEQGGKAALNQFLSREQIKRLREKEVFHTKTRQKTRPPDSSEKA
ncbi:MAG: PilZ domain-containing protein, partial [Deltaproteobacteria bacterium]|nr:PilZ domain-containing protein [Deltaproteobacteria bacterium]